jgi:hypothetical protein
VTVVKTATLCWCMRGRARPVVVFEGSKEEEEEKEEDEEEGITFEQVDIVCTAGKT